MKFFLRLKGTVKEKRRGYWMKSENLRFAPITIFYFAFLIEIIDNVIKYYSPYSSYYVTITSANSSTVYWSHDFRLYHMTTLLHCHWLKLW